MKSAVEVGSMLVGTDSPLGWQLYAADSEGRMGVFHGVYNASEKTMKYITFVYVPYNRVGDEVICTQTGKAEATARMVGPLHPNEASTVVFDALWNNTTVYDVKIKEITIEYIDNIKETINGTDIKNMDDADSVYSQKKKKKKKKGCYVATCVYGSYDCPQVWTLRRYRDNALGSTWYGRLFIRMYYAISPALVKWFGHTKWFKKLWKGKLDRMVAKLQSDGVEDTPYEDKEW